MLMSPNWGLFCKTLVIIFSDMTSIILIAIVCQVHIGETGYPMDTASSELETDNLISIN